MHGKHLGSGKLFHLVAVHSLAIGAIEGKVGSSHDRGFGGEWAKSSIYGRFASGYGRQRETDAAAMRSMQHGVPKAKQSLSRAQEKLARRKHDQHRIESGEAK